MLPDIENSRVMNIPSIYRFSGNNLIQPESVADHIAECIGIISILYSKFNVFKYDRAIYYASIHDIGECYTGDIVRPVKYSSPEMKKAFDELEYDMLKTNLCNFIAKEASECKHRDEFESALVGFVDVFQAAYKIYREYKLQYLSKYLNMLEYSIGVLYESFLPELKIYSNSSTNELIIYCEELVNHLADYLKSQQALIK